MASMERLTGLITIISVLFIHVLTGETEQFKKLYVSSLSLQHDRSIEDLAPAI